MISNSGHDENGKYSGGKAGDQTGKEWCLQQWYNRPWTVVLRHPNESVRELMANLAVEAANNDLIGYDQGDRYTFWERLKAAGYFPKAITVPCEADCSAGVAAICKAAGFLLGEKKLQGVSMYAYTGNLRQQLSDAGFKVLTDKKYLQNDKNILRGDVLLCEGHHTCINVTTGSGAEDKWYESAIQMDGKGLRVLTEGTAVRTGPSTAHKLLETLKEGSYVYATGKAFFHDKWWVHTSAGWISMVNLSGWIGENGRWWYLTEEKKYEYYAKTVVEIDGEWYAFDKDGWMITSDRISASGAIAG